MFVPTSKERCSHFSVIFFSLSYYFTSSGVVINTAYLFLLWLNCSVVDVTKEDGTEQLKLLHYLKSYNGLVVHVIRGSLPFS